MPPNDIVQYSFEESTHKDLSLKQLIHDIHGVLGDEGLDSKKINVSEIIDLMQTYRSDRMDWRPYTLFDPSRPYTRNLVDDGNGKFNLMILAWNQGQHSPIHSHDGSHCVMKILEGELQETLFDWPQSEEGESEALVILKDTFYRSDQVTYVHDKIGLHRVTNPSAQKGAVSLHLYTPPYKVCKTFEEKTGEAQSSGVCPFYSVNGVRCPSSM
ncbi:RmlC-like cupin domain-containing protein [Spinellus fusiger]|nr:RmlC-like cupin domain-containing protein [Spinellus fusiger]